MERVNLLRPHRRWRFGAACLDEASLVLTIGGRPVELERRPLQLLSLLLTNAGEIVTKEEILDALWPGREVSEASLTNCMARLRQGLGEIGHTAIRTVHGYGYRFAAPVTVEATSPAAAAPSAAAALRAGDPVPQRPNWRLVRSLGTGGFGDAWLTEQDKSGERRVVKFARDAMGLAALRREVALFRLLREGLGPRPDLIRILDWHFGEPPTFIETVWAEQGNLADWAARQGGAAAVPLAVRIDIAAGIAEALAAIHGMAVLHKDLKPANVLMRLDDAGKPGIILTDFGSGRALDPASLDAFGITRPDPDPTQIDSSGSTQIYRAPELASGGTPTAQADIFALGIILFQLAAGDLRRPFAPGWEELVPDPLLREDIALAAAGDPSRRLDSAASLAERLRTLEERRATRERAEAQAAEAAATRRALELARARRAPVVALVCVLVLGLAVSTALYLRAERALATAEAQAARAEAVTAFLTEDVFSAANPELGADPNVPVRRVLGNAAADLDRRFPPGSPDRAAIEAAIGGAYAGLGDATHALPLLRASLARLRSQLGEGDAQTQAVRLAMATLAEHRLDNAAMRQAGEAVLAAHPADPATELAARFYVLIADCGTNGNTDACATRLRPLLAETKERLGPRDKLTLRIQIELAHRLADAGHVAEAIPMARQTLALTEAIYGPDHLVVQLRRFELASALRDARQLDEAIPILIDVRARLLAITGGETDMSARVLNQLGMAYMDAKRYPESLQALQAVHDYSVRTRGDLADLSRATVNNLASTLVNMGRTTEAVAMAQTALDLERRVSGPDSADSIWRENNLASNLEKDGRLADATAMYRDVLKRARAVYTHGEWDLGQFEYRLAKLLINTGKAEEGRPLLADSVAILTHSLGPAAVPTTRASALLTSAAAAKP
jgi:non-specific serine/threonine protein kinase